MTMKAALLAAALLIATPALAANDADGAYCRAWAADTMAVGQILLPTNDTPGQARYKRLALIDLCLTKPPSGETAEPGYTIDTSPKEKPKPAAKKVTTKKAPPAAWEAACRKFVSLNEKDWTVVTTTSAPARVPCPAKPKE